MATITLHENMTYEDVIDIIQGIVEQRIEVKKLEILFNRCVCCVPYLSEAILNVKEVSIDRPLQFNQLQHLCLMIVNGNINHLEKISFLYLDHIRHIDKKLLALAANKVYMCITCEWGGELDLKDILSMKYEYEIWEKTKDKSYYLFKAIDNFLFPKKIQIPKYICTDL